MRFLLDQNRSPRLAVLLREAGHDAVHTLDLGLAEAEDDQVLDVADRQNRVLNSGDTDFGALLALLHRTSPSVVLFRARNLPQAQRGIQPGHPSGFDQQLHPGQRHQTGRGSTDTDRRTTTATLHLRSAFLRGDLGL